MNAEKILRDICKQLKKSGDINYMSKKKKQRQANGAFTKEDAYQSLEIVNTWINNIDTKVSFALALTGVLVGFIFGEGLPEVFKRARKVSKLTELSCCDTVALILICLLYMASFLAIISFMLAIMARVKNLNNAPSIFFFGSVGKMSLQNYMQQASGMTEEQIISDLKEQTHTNSRICSQKAKWYNIGMRFLIATVVLWFICMVFRLI